MHTASWPSLLEPSAPVDPAITQTFDAEPTGDRTPPSLPAHLELGAVLGQGGMGTVYEASDHRLGRQVAVKVMRAGSLSPRRCARFLDEARAVAPLRHPALVTVHDVDPGGAYIIMELVRGESLQQRLRRDGPLSAEAAIAIGVVVAQALALAHAAGLVHRDVKPANILLDASAGGAARLADFGIAQRADDALGGLAGVGTPAFAAPEQLEAGLVTPAADVYGLGATLFAAVTGAVAPPDGTIEVAVRAATDHGPLAAVIARAMAPQPDARFASASDLADALTAADHARRSARAAELAASARCPLDQRTPPPRRSRARRRSLATLVATVTLVSSGWWRSPAATAPVANRTAAASGRPGRTPEVRRIEAAIRQVFDRQGLEEARGLLQIGLAHAPDDPQLLYLAGIAAWWLDDDELRALVGSRLDRLDRGRDRDVIVGAIALHEFRVTDATATFERLAAGHPDDPDVLYGLAESYFHSGRGSDGMAVYRRLVELTPGFNLLDVHAHTWYIARREVEDAGRLAALLSNRRDTAAAVAYLAGDRDRALAVLGSASDLYLATRTIQIAAPDRARSHELARRLVDRAPPSAERTVLGYLTALATADAPGVAPLATAALIDRWRAAVAALATMQRWVQVDVGLPVIVGGLDLGVDVAEVERALASHGPERRLVSVDRARAIVAGRGRQRATLARLAASPFPPVRDLVAAYQAELDGAPAAALAAWRQVLASADSPSLLMFVHRELARVATLAGDGQAAAAACHELRAPRFFDSTALLPAPGCATTSEIGP